MLQPRAPKSDLHSLSFPGRSLHTMGAEKESGLTHVDILNRCVACGQARKFSVFSHFWVQSDIHSFAGALLGASARVDTASFSALYGKV